MRQLLAFCRWAWYCFSGNIGLLFTSNIVYLREKSGTGSQSIFFSAVPLQSCVGSVSEMQEIRRLKCNMTNQPLYSTFYNPLTTTKTPLSFTESTPAELTLVS